MNKLTQEQKMNMIFEYLEFIEEAGILTGTARIKAFAPQAKLLDPKSFGAGASTKKVAQAIVKPKAMGTLAKIGSTSKGGQKAVELAAKAAKKSTPGVLSRISAFAKKAKFLR